MNRKLASGVWQCGAEMDALAASLSGSEVNFDESLDREFEQRLADCPTLAYRVALSVLRNTAEAEDVAQEAMRCLIMIYESYQECSSVLAPNLDGEICT